VPDWRFLNPEAVQRLADMFVPTGVPLSLSGLKILGCPFGSPDFVTSFFSDLTHKHEALLSALPKLGHLQSAFLLLRFCALPRLSFVLRTLDPFAACVQAAASQYDDTLWACFAALLRLPDDARRTTSCVRRQAVLPVALGGMGLISMAAISRAAFFGMAGETVSDLWHRFSSHPIFDNNRSRFLRSEWMQCVFNVRASLAAICDRSDREPLPVLTDLLDRSASGLQHRISDAIHHASRDDWFRTMANRRMRARIRSSGGPGAGSWLSACPCTHTLTFPDRLFAVAVRLRLGCYIPCVALVSRCSCGGTVDPYGDHFLLCRSGNERNRRHAAGIRVWRSIFLQSRCSVRVEQLLRSYGIHLPDADSDRRSMDLVASPGWDLPGFPDVDSLFCDYTVVHPCASSYLVSAADCDGSAVLKAERKKNAKYKASVESKEFGRSFVPLACEVFGRLGQSFLALLRALAHVVSSDRTSDEVTSRGRWVERWMRSHSVALQCANARLILSRAMHASTAGMRPMHVSINDLLHDSSLDCDMRS
jgi:hypothetical protein